mmetsp:Transcript_20814/g.67444  ORF Transcript_20814/g.67444 Transcript_20814/m.67444 type:complete len:263 (-) Transcript_20814:238-1026(-)|eukprot:scaffold3945_cov105-Isochrysis_galbana.AAC.7
MVSAAFFRSAHLSDARLFSQLSAGMAEPLVLGSLASRSNGGREMGMGATGTPPSRPESLPPADAWPCTSPAAGSSRGSGSGASLSAISRSSGTALSSLKTPSPCCSRITPSMPAASSRTDLSRCCSRSGSALMCDCASNAAPPQTARTSEDALSEAAIVFGTLDLTPAARADWTAPELPERRSATSASIALAWYLPDACFSANALATAEATLAATSTGACCIHARAASRAPSWHSGALSLSMCGMCSACSATIDASGAHSPP